MKTEQEIKERIKALAQKDDLPSLIGSLMLLWVLDTDPAKLESYTGHIVNGLTEIANYINEVDQSCQPSDAPEQLPVP